MMREAANASELRSLRSTFVVGIRSRDPRLLTMDSRGRRVGARVIHGIALLGYLSSLLNFTSIPEPVYIPFHFPCRCFRLLWATRVCLSLCRSTRLLAPFVPRVDHRALIERSGDLLKMGSCLPFMLLSSSIPLTLQSNVSDPAFSDLASDQRPGSSLSNSRPSIDTQPPPTPSPVPQYRRFSKYEQRRAHSSPEGSFPAVGTPGVKRPLSGRFRKTRSAPSTLGVPLVTHQQWVGVRKDGKGKRRVSDPVETVEITFEAIEIESRVRRSSAPPPLRSSFILPSPRHSVDSSRLSSSSTLAPSLSSAVLRPESRIIAPPSPPLQTLEERDEEDNERLQLPVLQFDSLGISCPPSPPLSTLAEEDAEEIQPAPARRSSKKVSFSSAEPIIITAHQDSILAESEPLRRQSSWSGLFLLSAPPAAARPPLRRHASLQSVRGQAAGRSILRRTSSFTNDIPQDDPSMSFPVVERKRLPRSKNGQRTTSPSPALPSLRETEPTSDGEAQPPSVIHSSISDDESKFSRTYGVVQKAEIKKVKASGHAVALTLPRLRKPERAFSLEQRAVRHWSMEGVGHWVRRNGIHGSGGCEGGSERNVPPVPPLPRDVEALKA